MSNGENAKPRELARLALVRIEVSASPSFVLEVVETFPSVPGSKPKLLISI